MQLLQVADIVKVIILGISHNYHCASIPCHTQIKIVKIMKVILINAEFKKRLN